MSEPTWNRIHRRRLTRRAMLGWSARMGVGAAGLALVGCGDDDDGPGDEPETVLVPDQSQEQAPEQQAPADDPAPQDQEEPQEQAPQEQEVPQARPTIAIDEIELAGAMGSVLLVNTGTEAVSLDGWWICQRPAYWPFPDVTLQPGAQLRIRTEDGVNSADELFANGRFGTLSNNGEVAVYTSSDFNNPSEMVTYVGWGNGGGRVSQARSAGLWGDTNVEASLGQVLRRMNDATGAEAYSVADMETTDEPAAAGEPPAGFGPVVVDRLYLDGNDMIQLRNIGDAAYSLDGHWLCQFPDYWTFPAGVELAPGATIFINTGSGENSVSTLFAGGSFGRLRASGGEVGLYRSPDFGNSDDIASYIAWNRGGARQGVANGAGIWGDNLEAKDGDVFVYDGFGAGTALYVKE